MSRFKLYFSIFSLCFQLCIAQISDKRLCIDAECSRPVSYAKTLTTYFAKDLYYLSFQRNEDVIIYSKSAGSNENLWGAEIKGKRGYIPYNLVRETRVLKEKPTLLVDTEISKVSNVPQVPERNEIVNPSKVKQSYEVIDGTTIYIQPEDNITEETQVKVEGSATEGSEIPISDFNKIAFTEEIDNEKGKTIKTKLHEIDSKTGIIEELSDETEPIQHTYRNQDKTSENLDQSNRAELNSKLVDIEIDEEKLNQTEEKLEQLSEKDGVKRNDMEIEDNDDIKISETKSIESDQVDTDGNENFSGLFGNILEKVMEAMDGNDNTVDSHTEEELKPFEETGSNEQVVSTNNKPEIIDSESDVLIESTIEETKQFEDSSEASTTQLPDNTHHIIQENISENEDILKKNNESKDPKPLLSNVEQLDVNNTNNLNNQIFQEEKPSSVEKVGILHIPSSHQLFEDDKNSLGNTSENYKEKFIEHQSVLKNDNMKKSEQLIEDSTENSKTVDNLTFEENESNVNSNTTTDNLIFVDPNISLNQESDITNAEAANLTIPSVSDEPYIENRLANASSTEEIVDTLYNTSKYEQSGENIEQPVTIEKSNHTLADGSEVDFNDLGNQEDGSTETLYKSNEVEVEYSTTVESIDKQGDNFEQDEFESQKSRFQEDEEREQQDENKEDEILEVSSGKFSDSESQESDQNKKIASSNYNEFNSQNSEKLAVPDGLIDSVSESTSEHGDNFMQYDIGSQGREEHINPDDIYENEVHRKDDNLDVLQGMPSDFSLSDEDNHTQEAESSNYNNLNIKNLPSGNAADVEQELKTFGDFIAWDLPIFSSEFFLYLVTTAVSVIIFLLGYFALDKSRREAPLVAKINNLEKEFLILLKEKELLAEEIENGVKISDCVDNSDFLNLQKQYEDAITEKEALKVEIQTLEKELENSTEVGLELNRMLSDILSSENAGSILMSNIEKLQAQLVEQQGIVSNMKEMLSLKETENHELHLELEIANKKVIELQSELDRLLLNIIKIEEEKEIQEKNSESEKTKLKEEIDALTKIMRNNEEEYIEKVDGLKNKLSTCERNLQLKIKEFDGMKISIQKIRNLKNGNTLDSLLEVNSIKAELEQMKTECQSHCETLRLEQETNALLEKKAKMSEDEANLINKRYDEVDKARLELETKLQVLTNYFKDKEAQLQKELSNYESMWSARQGEATSTSERIKYLQSEVQNFKAQNESLKQEIVSQEVELKSQISVLEKKVHENWVSARQAERRLEDLKQEAAHLRNRLTLSERALQEDKVHNRMQSPLDKKVDLPVSPLHLDTPSSPLLYDSRDHITKSPPILGMPPPFLPPPPGNPFLPPPHLPFMPPPLPDMFPGDRRPPPLGRMSSPPLNSRYSPDRRSYSPYDRRSPSPSYDESEYGTSPVRHRRYSPFSNRADHRRIGRMNGRSGELSSGSGNSNESINGLNHPNVKV